ncbi:MAG: DUF4349 domain-containing protein [Deltaproteobacteria bacterium]|nr:DUF4349 domain-containing protein [Deltaproteobacteria bacterium]MBN2671695.1 DUF4349 domain-containing protein [Deltaproteobacteria bacterium]
MKNIYWWGILIVLLTACGGASHGAHNAKMASADAAYAPSQMDYETAAADDYVGQSVGSEYYVEDMEYAEEEAESMPAPMSAGNSSSVSMEREMKKSVTPKSPQRVPGSKQAPQQVPNTDKAQTKGPKPDDPMIIYSGYLHLRVKRLLDALDAISDITKEAGGYVDSMTKTSIVVRIPGDRFDEMIVAFAQLGDLLSKEISAIEVTAQYTDIKARLAVAEEAKARLLALLEKVQKADERLRILEEIKRLSEQIESIKSTLATLQNLLKYFTVTIDLTPILQDDASIQHQSPFAWVNELSPHRMTIFGGAKQFTMKLPDDFVLFSKDENYRAQAADTTIIRGGVMDNNPVGNNAFWTDAISYEMKGRSESLEDQGTTGNISYLLFKNADLKPRWYLVGVSVVGDKVIVIEVFFPNETAFNAHKDDVLDALKTFEVNR